MPSRRPRVKTRSDLPVCDFCKAQDAPYSCPSCNSNYCSISCFRSQEHSECSEKFYRNSMLGDLTSQQGGDEERIETLKMLQRLQQGDQDFESLVRKLEKGELNGDGSDQEDNQDEEEDDDYERIAQALENVDLDSISSEELLKLLGNKQKEEFFELLNDHYTSSKLLEQVSIKKPWWQRPFVEDDEQENDANYTLRPSFIENDKLVNLSPNAKEKALTMIWNVVAMLFGYVHVIRTVDSTGTEKDTSKSILKQIVPFLFEQSTFVYKDLDSVAADFRSVTTDQVSQKSYQLYLHDISTLLSPRSVTILSNAPSSYDMLENHQNRDTLRSLCHLSEIVQSNKRAYLKVLYYVSLVMSIAPQSLRQISTQLSNEADKLEQESQGQQEAITNIEWLRKIDKNVPSSSKSKLG